jgi:hypothetical protein
LTDEMLEAIADITALRTGAIRAEDIDRRAAARWIQLFGRDALTVMLAETGPDAWDAAVE